MSLFLSFVLIPIASFYSVVPVWRAHCTLWKTMRKNLRTECTMVREDGRERVVYEVVDESVLGSILYWVTCDI